MAEPVVFSAWADQGGNYGPFSENKTLVFNMEIINIGGAYDSATGIFKAPVPGVYYFTFFYRAGGPVPSGLSLMKNSDVIVKTHDPLCSVKADNGGNAAILKLQAGDKVSVRLHENTGVSANDRSTTFSGFLVR